MEEPDCKLLLPTLLEKTTEADEEESVGGSTRKKKDHDEGIVTETELKSETE